MRRFPRFEAPETQEINLECSAIASPLRRVYHADGRKHGHASRTHLRIRRVSTRYMTRLKTGSYEVVRLTHWNTQEADSDLDTRNGDHGRPNATINDPVVGLPSQGEAEEVLKDDHACEA